MPGSKSLPGGGGMPGPRSLAGGLLSPRSLPGIMGITWKVHPSPKVHPQQSTHLVVATEADGTHPTGILP